MAKTTKKTKSDDFSKKVSKAKERKWKLSASMLKTFLKCKKQFFENYLAGTPQPANESFSLGNGAHHALELANLFQIENPRDLTSEEIELFIDAGRDFLSKNSYVSSMETYSTMETLVRDELMRPFEEKVIAAEVKFDITTPEGVPITGYIDKVTEVDSKTIRILDYKTSKTAMASSEAEHDEQLSMYDLAGTILYPNYPNRILELRYLRLGESVETRRDEFFQYQFRKQISSIYNAILEFVGSVTKSPAGTLNPLCNWCAFNSKCDEYSEQLDNAQDQSGFVPLTDLTDSSAVSELQNANLIAKAIDNRKTELKLWMAQRLEEDPDTPISNGDIGLRINPLCISRRTYNAKELAKLLTPEELLEVATISSTKVNKLLQKLPDSDRRVAIERTAQVSFNNPQYRLTKK